MTAADITTDKQTGDTTLTWIGADERGRELTHTARQADDQAQDQVRTDRT